MTATLPDLNAVPDAEVATALDAAWTGDSVNWPYTASILARVIEQQQRELDAVTAERDGLVGVTRERVDLWAGVETLRRQLMEAHTRISEQAKVIGRARAVWKRTTTGDIHSGIPARRAAKWIATGSM